MKKIYIICIIVAVVGLGVWYAFSRMNDSEFVQEPPKGNGEETGSSLVASAKYICAGGKTIRADFYQGAASSSASNGEPPTPSGLVHLTLNDGTSMSLAQTISADGIRYANPDESFIFWSKGNGAVVLQENREKDYMNCIVLSSDTTAPDLTQAYGDGSKGFSLRLPPGYGIDEQYHYEELGPGKAISGTKFTIPAAMASGTNLSSDTYLSVETLPNKTTCMADLFLEPGRVATSVRAESDYVYSVASTTGAGVGNRYEETVYALQGTSPCMAVRYWIHYGVIENYPAGAVREFDKQALLKQFDEIRSTLVVNQ
jgi:hypothetical protein